MSNVDGSDLAKQNQLEFFWSLGLNIMPGYFFVPWRQPEDEVKHPSVKWTRWQTERIPWETVQQYHESRLQAEWCVITGAVSGVVVVDADDPQALSWCERHLPKTPITCETKRGRHYYFRHPGVRVGNRVNVFADLNGRIDVRGDGGIAVLLGPNRRREPEWTAEAWAEMPVYDPDWFPRIKVNTDAPAGTETREHAEIISEPSFGPVETRVRLARDYLRGCPGAVQGNGADAYAYGLAACVAWEFALPIGKANEVLFEWGQREDQKDTVGNWYPWDEADIARKILATIEEGPRARKPGSRLRGNHYTLPDDFGKYKSTSAEQKQESTEEPKSKFRSLSMDEMFNMTEPEWTVDKHLTQGGLGVVFAPSGSFKSFWAVDLSLSVAHGVPFLGKFGVRKGSVCYLAGEGLAGLPKRVRAWIDARGQSGGKWRCLSGGLDLFNPVFRSEILVDLVRQFGGLPSLVVIDTVSRHFAGRDTLDNREMQSWCDGIQRDWCARGITVLLVHHAGWNEGRERGASSIRDCADATFSLAKTKGSTNVEVDCLKQKDAEPVEAYGVSGRQVGGSLVFDFNGPAPTPEEIVSRQFPTEPGKARTIDDMTSLRLAWIQANGWKESTFKKVAYNAKGKGFLAEHHEDVKLPKNKARRLYSVIPAE